MRSSRGRVCVLLASLLVATAVGSGCTRSDESRPAPVPSATPSEVASPSATAVAAQEPNDHDLGAALPGPDEVGGITGYTSCVTGEQVCYAPYSSEPDATLSWVRAPAQVPSGLRARWVDLMVNRPAEDYLVETALGDARALCPQGEWVRQADPRGFHPSPPMEGKGRLHPIERAGFRGLRCAMELGPVGGARHGAHRITAVRGDVVLRVSASSRRLLLRLFEEYVDRLG